MDWIISADSRLSHLLKSMAEEIAIALRNCSVHIDRIPLAHPRTTRWNKISGGLWMRDEKYPSSKLASCKSEAPLEAFSLPRDADLGNIRSEHDG